MDTNNILLWNDVKRVSEYWKKVDLKSSKATLDTAALNISDKQEKFKESRKLLGTSTKEFRKLPDEEKLSALTKLLKQYQAEIDELTKRSQDAEGSFLQVYGFLKDAPDPYLTLNRVLLLDEEKQQNNSNNNNNNNLGITVEQEKNNLAATVELMEEKLKEYEREFSELKNQEVTIRTLQDRVKELEEGRGRAVIEEVERQQKGWLSEKEKMLANYQRQEIQLKEQNEDLKREIEDSRKKFDTMQSQLLYEKKQLVEINNTQTSQIDLLNEEIMREKLNKVNHHQMKKMNSNNFVDFLDNNNNNNQEDNNGVMMMLKLELGQKESELKHLKAEMENLQKEVSKKDQVIEVASKENSHLKEEVDTLEQQLSLRPSLMDYETLKKRLRTLEELEFNNGSNTTTATAAASMTSDDLTCNNKSIEQLLNEKVKKLEGELAQMRVAFHQQQNESTTKGQELRDSLETIEKQKELIEKLERDLTIGINKLEEMGTSTASSTTVVSSSIRTTGSSNSSTAGAAQLQPITGGETRKNVTGSHEDDNVIMSVISEQRNRFRSKAEELQERLLLLTSQLEQMRLERDTLKNDNVSLYEKVKYLQSYRGGHFASAFSSSPPSVGTEVGSTIINIHDEEFKSSSTSTANNTTFNSNNALVPPHSRYKQIYDEKLKDNLNPFKSFAEKERLEKYKDLSIGEKILLQLARIMISNRYIRLLMFAYFTLLHLITFLSIYIYIH